MKRFLITAGPTREYIDSVRFISNGSTGRMGYALAEEALRRGNEVVLVSGPTALRPPEGAQVHAVTSAQDMAGVVLDRLPDAAVLIATAAVCDWRPEMRSPRKLPKRHGPPVTAWVRTPDILKLAGERKGDRLHMGFALEDTDEHANAARKLEGKNLDYIVLNGPESLGGEGGCYRLLARSGRAWTLGHLTKERLAALLIGLALDGESVLPLG